MAPVSHGNEGHVPVHAVVFVAKNPFRIIVFVADPIGSVHAIRKSVGKQDERDEVCKDR